MKYFLILVVCMAIEANAQTSKETYMIGGSSWIQRYQRNYDNTNQQSYREGSLSFSPTVGYFVIDNFLIGIQDTFSKRWVLNDTFNERINEIGPVFRYYVTKGKFAIFPELVPSFTSRNVTFSGFGAGGGFTRTDQNNASSLKLGLGAVWFITNYIGFESLLSYKYTNIGGGDDRLLKLNFGLQFYLARKDG